MTVFWSLATAMSLLALLFVVLPLLRPRKTGQPDLDELNKDVARTRLAELDAELGSGRIEQAQYDADREDLERELLYDLSASGSSSRPERSGLWAVLVIAIAVPLSAALLYRTIGSERIITLLAEFPQGRPAEQQAGPQMSVEEMVTRLAERMQSEPDNLQGWVMLARSYIVLDRHDLAVPAFRNILRLGGGDSASMLADFADALVATNDGRFPDEAGTYLTRAVELEPDNVKALWLSGHWKMQSGEPASAIEFWERAAQGMQPDSKDWQVINGQIADARAQAGLPAAAVAVQKAADDATGSAELQVSVSLAAELQAETRPDDTVFIYARAVSGPRMPLAIARKKVSDLPVTVTLNDSMAMTPATKLSGFRQVSVGARISRTGNAMPQSGDLQGMQSPVTVPATLDILIDSKIP